MAKADRAADLFIEEMRHNYNVLRNHFGSHTKVAEWLGLSYNRYNEIRWRPDQAPRYQIRLIELAVFWVRTKTKKIV